MRSPTFTAMVLLGLACASRGPIPGVVRAGFGETLTSIPGPMPGFGPFEKFSDALMAACPVILNQPNATAGRPTDQHFQLRWMLSEEYCAWLCYTPDHKYEMSMLAAGKIQDDSQKRTCRLPPIVNDPRYSPKSLGYVFVLHNHSYENKLSDLDIRFIVDMAAKHGVAIKTKSGEVPISITAQSRREALLRATLGGLKNAFTSTLSGSSARPVFSNVSTARSMAAPHSASSPVTRLILCSSRKWVQARQSSAEIRQSGCQGRTSI